MAVLHLIMVLSAGMLCAGVRAQDFASNPSAAGKALVEDLLSRVPAEDSEMRGLLKIRAPQQPLYEVPVKMSIQLTETGWKDIYESEPVLHHPAEILVIEHRFGQPNRYFYGQGRGMGPAPAPEPLSTNSIWQPFAGSDFYIADLGLHFLHWHDHRVLKREVRKTRSTHLVESINPNPAISAYSRVLSWLDVETGNLIMAQAFDHQNKLAKEFSVRKISRQRDRVEVKEIEIRSEQTDARTRLEFDLSFAP